MALPSGEEKILLATEMVADILTREELDDDMFLLKWLRARDLNLDKAEEMLRNAKKWRKANNLDSSEPFPDTNPYYAENFPMWCDGIDKEGRPIITSPIGKWDVRKVGKFGSYEEFTVYLTGLFEQGSQSIKVAEKIKRETLEKTSTKLNTVPITQALVILDWDGFAWGQLFSYKCVQNFLQIGSIYEAFYPECLYKAFFINCPSLISGVLKLLKPVVAPKTMSKIVCLGTDRQQWTSELSKYLNEDQVRPQFGGTKDINSHANPFRTNK